MPSRTSTPSPLFARLAIAVASAGVGLGLAWYVVGKEEPRDTVVVVDTSAELQELIEERAARARAAPVPPIVWRGEEWPGLVVDAEDKAAYIERFKPVGALMVSDPHAYFAPTASASKTFKFAEHPQGQWKWFTNAAGLRGRTEVLAERGDLRVLSTGDSHVDGVCRDFENFPAVLGRLLEEARPDEVVESLNGGVGGYGPYHYLGVLERFLHLEPHVFVVTVFGGNDFQGAQMLRRYYERRPRAERDDSIPKLAAAGVEMRGLRPQEIDQAAYFHANPSEVDVAIETMVAVTDGIATLAEENGIEVVFVYLPPSLRGQPWHHGDTIARIESARGADFLASSDRVADVWLEFVRDRDLAALDLRPVFAEHEEPLYWATDHHINVEGQRVIAEALLPIVDRLAPPQAR